MLGIEEITEDERLDALEGEWRALHDEGTSDSVFLSFEWLRRWWTHFGGESQSLFVLCARDADRLQAILPLVICRERRRGLTQRTLRFLGSGLSDRLGVLCRPGMEGAAAEAFADHLEERAGSWDRLDLVDLPHDDDASRRLAERLAKRGLCGGLEESHPCPFLDVETDWESFYHAQINTKTRSNNRNKTRRLEKQGTLAIRFVTDPADVPTAIESVFGIDERDVHHGDARQRPFDVEGGRAFFRDVTVALAHRGWLFLALMELDDEPIAYRLNFRHRSRHFDYFTGYSLTYNRYSPGRLLATAVLESCFTSGIERVDFLRGFDDWKTEWTDRFRRNAEIHGSSPSLRSRLQRLVTAAPGIRSS
jgi:CelD/BcsL family acetyltransferase involved in cellulose biosynthesis